MLDRSFAPCVGATTGFGVFVGAEAVAVLVQPDGKLVAVGRYFEAARYVGTGAATACEPAVPYLVALKGSDAERQAVLAALRAHGTSRKAATALGMAKSTFCDKVRRYRMEKP